METDALFAMADAARTALRREAGGDANDSDEDPSQMFVNPPCRVRTGRAFFSTSECGEVHVCFGPQCPHIQLDREHNWVCGISGRVVAIECSRDHDPSWTGRSTGSANPDDSAGTPVGGWVKRRDMFGASVAAFRDAAQISDAEVAPLPAGAPAPVPAAKRGALCVDELPDASAPPKRPRSSRKENWSREAIDKMAAEAVGRHQQAVHRPAPPRRPRRRSTRGCRTSPSSRASRSGAT